ncbi:hypothetical protein LXL04_016872 [Taraxacum kok-saghyz]
MVPGANRVQSSEAPLWKTGLLRMLLLSLRGGFEPGRRPEFETSQRGSSNTREFQGELHHTKGLMRKDLPEVGIDPGTSHTPCGTIPTPILNHSNTSYPSNLKPSTPNLNYSHNFHLLTNSIPSMAASSSSSSSSSVQKTFKYDVFLSFRGADIRKSFIGHLYQALQDKGIYTYKDDERITKGKMISDNLLESIEDSRFYIVVFSKNYASSSWCLKELVKIMECHNTKKHIAYPVFLDVEPTEVRYQTGAVGEAFSKHVNKEAAGKWRKALKDAADLAGWELKNTADGSEASFIKKIIEDISIELYNINFSFDKNLVGIETRVNDIVSSLEIGSDDVRMIGIKGMGGAGKTTLARAVFDKISIQFEGKSFVENVREVTNTPSSGLKSLQQQILSHVLNDKDMIISGVRDGQNIMKRRMRGRKVLIALDDVDDVEQLEALAGEPEWFKSGSRIIITTRDEQVLLAHGVTLIHGVSLLSNKEAICLFSKYAFRREGPVQVYEELVEQVVHYAAGLPLIIKVLGSLLFGKDKPEWEDVLQRLKTIPLSKTMEILKLSYTALECDHKEIFLDVACMLKGQTKNMVIQRLEGCGYFAKIGLRVLQQKSLITIYKYCDDDDDDEYVGMHDHIKEMAMYIVRGSHPDMPHKHSRLWNDDEIEHILANDLVRIKFISKFEKSKTYTNFMVTMLQGTEETRYIEFNGWNVGPDIIMNGIGKMKALRFFKVCIREYNKGIDRCKIIDFKIYSFPDALRYLCFRNYPFRCLPKTFQANNLVTLEMPFSNLVLLWELGEHKVRDKLRFLDLSGSELRTLDLRVTPNIETLDLSGCNNLVDLPDGMWTLKHLKSLKLRHCQWLDKLPEDLCRSGCLEVLDFQFTNIKHLPDSICLLKHLKYLLLDGCKFLEKLPEDVGHLECLEYLTLSRTKIKHIPDSICMLKYLKDLILNNSLLEKLPEDLGRLACLKMLLMEGTSISHLPQSILLLKGLYITGPRGCLESVGFTSLIQTHKIKYEEYCYIEV